MALRAVRVRLPHGEGPARLRDAFHILPEYLEALDTAAEEVNFADLGNSFRAIRGPSRSGFVCSITEPMRWVRRSQQGFATRKLRRS